MMKPCVGCGGEKEPGQGKRFCPSCRAASAEKRHQRKLAYDRARRPAKPCRCGSTKEPGRHLCGACLESKQERRREYDRRRYAALHPPRPKKVKEKKARVRKPSPQKKRALRLVVPADIRSVWRKSHPNSQMQRLYPTMRELEKRFGVPC